MTLPTIAALAHALAEPGDWRLPLGEFLDAHYALWPDPERLAASLAEAPAAPTPAFAAALAAAAAETLAARWNLPAPPWCATQGFDLTAPVFLGHPALAPRWIADSPPAFRRRMLFTEAVPLRRATMPTGRAA